MDVQTIETLYRTYGPSVLRRARRILGDEQAARDALQEVFVRALREREAFRGGASPMTWLYRVTTNHCLNVLRDGSRRRGLLERRVAPTLSAGREGGAEASADVALLLRHVPEDLRAVAICFYVDEMTQAEAAEHLGVSRRTVGYRLQAFREAVRPLTLGTTDREVAS